MGKVPVEVREAGRQYAALRREQRKRCEECDTPFVGIATKRFCSDKCRVRANRVRHREAAKVEHTQRIAEAQRPTISTLPTQVEKLALVERIARDREERSRGHIFSDSAVLVREMRDAYGEEIDH